MDIQCSPTTRIHLPVEIVHIIFRFATYAECQLEEWDEDIVQPRSRHHRHSSGRTATRRTTGSTSRSSGDTMSFIGQGSQSQDGFDVEGGFGGGTYFAEPEVQVDEASLWGPGWGGGGVISPFAPLSDMARERSWEEADFTRKSLVLVSKAWRLCALQFRWLYFRFRDIWQIENVATLFRKSRSSTHWALNLGGDYGHWTRRIDLRVLELDSNNQRVEGKRHADAVVAVLTCCPNLRIFTDQGTWCLPYRHHATPRDTIHTLATNCARSLHTVVWAKGVGPNREEFAYLLRSCQNIRTLCLDFVTLKASFSHQSLTAVQIAGTVSASTQNVPICLPNLLWLQINTEMVWLAAVVSTWDMPRLREVVAKGWPMGKSLANFEGLLRTHGHKLRSLYLPHHPSTPRAMNVGMFVQHCPNLGRLALSVSGSSPIVHHPSLSVVALYSSSWGTSSEVFGPSQQRIAMFMMQLNAHFQAVQSAVPGVQVVRLPGFTKHDAMTWSSGIVDWWERWMENWEESEVRFEGGRGEQMRALFQEVFSEREANVEEGMVE